MGLFINTLPLRVDLSNSVHDSVLQTQERLASLLEHEHASLVLAQRCSNIPRGTSLFSSLLNYRHNATSSELTSIDAGIEDLDHCERTNYPFTISVEDSGTSLGLTMDVLQPLDADRVCGFMQQSLQSIAEALEHTPGMLANQLEILPVDERQLLLQTWNATQQDYPSHSCIHQLFEQQVERTPQATALVLMDQSLTYSELNTRANKLAHRLIELGVRPDSLVAICVERSFAMVVGMLAIVKAGGAYVPLDPTYASKRLNDILADSETTVVLADNAGRAAIGEEALSAMTVIDPNTALNERSNKDNDSNPQVPGLTSCHLAYIIYTSGSTGIPKGVLIEHQGVVNFLLTRQDVYGIRKGCRVLQFSSFGFDGSVMDVFATLGYGGTIYLLPDHIRYNPEQLWDYLRDQE
ncbi:hypothetical protein BGZ65_011620, partial [Modicella reniformis]